MGVTTTYTITSAADLATDIRAIDKTGSQAASDTNYVFNFAPDATLNLTQQLDAINLDSGSTLTINGNGSAINGGDVYNGLFVYAGTVSINDLLIENAKAIGGAGGTGSHGGGGGAGLGGGLFVASGGNVTLQGVDFDDDSAVGGAGGAGGPADSHNGGGGGLEGGAGGNGTGGGPTSSGGVGGYGGGGGGVGLSATGGTGANGVGGPGIIPGASAGQSGSANEGEPYHSAGGKSAGGGGAGLTGGSGGVYGGGGGVYGSVSRPDGYGVEYNAPIAGDFGGGGGGFGGKGGFGGGGGGGIFDITYGGKGAPPTTIRDAGTPGFGGGAGGTGTHGGGGGLGAGGDIFVQQGGKLVIEDGVLGAGTVAGGAAAGSGSQPGDGFGSALFIQGNAAVTLAALPGQTLTVQGTIADEDGSIADSGGAGTLIVGGGGAIALLAANTYTGNTTVTAGTTLDYDADGALGSGQVSLLDASELIINSAVFGFQTGVFDGPVDATTLPYGASGILPGGAPQYIVEDRSGGTELIPQTMTVSDITGLIAAVHEFSDASQSPEIKAFMGAPASPSFTIELSAAITLDPDYGDSIVHVDLAAGTTLTVAGDAIAGSGLVVLDGGGTFVPTGANTFAAPIVDMDDTLVLAADDNPGPTANGITLQAGSTLAFAAQFKLGHPLQLDAGLDSVTVDPNLIGTLSGRIAGSGTLVVIAPEAELDLVASNDFSGGVVLDSGVLLLSAQNAAGSGPIVFAIDSDPVLEFTANDAPRQSIEQFYNGDTIIIDNFVATTTKEVAGSITTSPELTLQGGGGNVTLHLPGVVFADLLIRTVGPDTVITTDQVLCFAAGTRIATPAGARPIETLHPGQTVFAAQPDAALEARTVRWVGRRVLDLAAHPDPALAAPVRVRAGALGAGLPQRDLIVSPDHCLLLDGHLLRAFRLINGVSVVQERPASIAYWHVELADHALLLAEGVAAESYLDEGMRGFFDGAAALPGPLRPRAMAACAPYAPDDAFAERLWRAVAARAGAVLPPPAAAAEPAVFAGTLALRPVLTAGDRRLYALPPGARSLRLVSAAERPTATQPWRADRRRLGAGLRRVRVDTGTRLAIDGAAFGPGWHAAEGAAVRWSSGDALLHVPHGTRIVELQLAS